MKLITIINNLIKLVTAGINDDQKVIFASITHGKTISPEEAQKILKENMRDCNMQYAGTNNIWITGILQQNLHNTNWMNDIWCIGSLAQLSIMCMCCKFNC